MIFTVKRVLGIKGRNRPVPSYLAAETFGSFLDILLGAKLLETLLLRILFEHHVKCVTDVVKLEP